jgi:hypothetical protein
VEEETHSFIIRIWDADGEKFTHPEEAWRGSIDYVGSDRRLYFNDLNSIAAFIREQVVADSSADEHAVRRWEALVERSRLGGRIRSFWQLLTHRWLKRFYRPGNST